MSWIKTQEETRDRCVHLGIAVILNSREVLSEL